jgi:hypothetical protein
MPKCVHCEEEATVTLYDIPLCQRCAQRHEQLKKALKSLQPKTDEPDRTARVCTRRPET